MPDFFANGGDSLAVNFNLYRDINVDQWMCSSNCPCPADTPFKNDWISVPALDLGLTYDRTMPLQFGPIQGETFTVMTYEECVERAVENKFAAPLFVKFATGWTASNDYTREKDFLRFFENQYNCSGICEKALFFYSKSVSTAGKPTSCFEDIKREVKESMLWLGVTVSVTGFFTIILWTFQYCLWRKY